ncbi:MAG: putative toxin-antitoxin system toxin component, PIN family [Nitrospirae bacterium]|nr:putative toxin-antitoxin system toxin component, PIN family [Nitrospirota bacterium]
MGKKTKVVIDSNVLVSAFGWHGTPEEIVLLATTGEISNFTSTAMLSELVRVVGYQKLRFPESLQAEIIETVFTSSSLVNMTEPLKVINSDPADNRVLECAVAACVDFIISGDKHLLDLKKFGGIEIVTPEDFLLKTGKGKR